MANSLTKEPEEPKTVTTKVHSSYPPFNDFSFSAIMNVVYELCKKKQTQVLEILKTGAAALSSTPINWHNTCPSSNSTFFFLWPSESIVRNTDKLRLH